jgi:hypothetical protein
LVKSRMPSYGVSLPHCIERHTARVRRVLEISRKDGFLAERGLTGGALLNKHILSE